jgi:Divergent InlB B-repeat domain/Interleukin-like EMT inducer
MGSLVLLSVADEAGLNLLNSCNQYSGSACFENGIAALEALGSTQIRSYCFRDSWAMIAVKGAGHAIAEGLSSSGVVSLLSGLPDPGSFGLTVNKSGQGTGTIRSDPAGIACGSGCQQQTATFGTSTLVALTATAAPGFFFIGWSGDPDCADGVVTVDANKTCTANFGLGGFLLSVSKQGTGSGTVTSAPAGISCGTTCSAAFSAGAMVVLLPSADTGSVFVAWSGACSGIGVCNVTMDAAKSVTATFARRLQFFTVAPCRVFDTRTGTRLVSGSARTFQLTGFCGLPSTATAVSTNLTVVGPTGGGYVVLFPGNANVPVTSTINFNATQTRANKAIVGLAADGSGTVGALAVIAGNGTTDLVLDVNGYFD